MIVMSHVWWVMPHTWWGKLCQNTLQHTLQHTATHACRPRECESCDFSVSHIWWGTHWKTHCNTHSNTLQHMHAGHENVKHVTLPYAFSWVGLFGTTLSLSHAYLVAVCCSVLQCVLQCVLPLRYDSLSESWRLRDTNLHESCISCCSVLQCVAVCVAVCWRLSLWVMKT